MSVKYFFYYSQNVDSVSPVEKIRPKVYCLHVWTQWFSWTKKGEIIIIIIIIISTFCNARLINPQGFSRHHCVTATAHAWVVIPEAARQAFYTQNRNQKLWTRNMEGFRFQVQEETGVPGEDQDQHQTHIQSLAGCIGERKLFEH